MTTRQTTERLAALFRDCTIEFSGGGMAGYLEPEDCALIAEMIGAAKPAAPRLALRQTRTYAELEVPAEFYDHVVTSFLDAGYEHTFARSIDGPERGLIKGGTGVDVGAIDMHGIALTRGAEQFNVTYPPGWHLPVPIEALDKIATDLAWRGPNGKTLEYVNLTREQAEAIATYLGGDRAPASPASNEALPAGVDETAPSMFRAKPGLELSVDGFLGNEGGGGMEPAHTPAVPAPTEELAPFDLAGAMPGLFEDFQRDQLDKIARVFSGHKVRPVLDDDHSGGHADNR